MGVPQIAGVGCTAIASSNAVVESSRNLPVMGVAKCHISRVAVTSGFSGMLSSQNGAKDCLRLSTTKACSARSLAEDSSASRRRKSS